MQTLSNKIYLGFDYGRKFIGVAVGNSLTKSAKPIAQLKTKPEDNLIRSISLLISEWKPNGLVFGVPENSAFKDNSMAEETLKFIEKIKEKFSLDVFTVDEHLTTRGAKNILQELRKTSSPKKEDLDSFAAKLILEDFLASIN